MCHSTLHTVPGALDIRPAIPDDAATTLPTGSGCAACLSHSSGDQTERTRAVGTRRVEQHGLTVEPSHLMEEMASTMSPTAFKCVIRPRLRAASFLPTSVLVPETISCGCCSSSRVVVVLVKCDDCGALTLQRAELPYAREKRDRRREPRE